MSNQLPPIQNPKSENRNPTDLRRHRTITDRNLLFGFFFVLAGVGGALIWVFYGGLGFGAGLLCFIGAAVVVGVLFLILFGLGRLSDWLEDRAE
jgi:hypothetical protein